MTKTSADLAARIGLLRRETFGEDGVSNLAGALRLSPQMWRNYEGGVEMPARVVLGFILLTGANPLWLFTGEGDRYQPSAG